MKDEELIARLAKGVDCDQGPCLRELERRGSIGVRFVYQDKSGSVYRFHKGDEVPGEVAGRWVVFKLEDAGRLRYGEKEALFQQAAEYGLGEAVPLILRALEGERRLGPHISAAVAFGRMRAGAAREWLERNLVEEHRDSLGVGGMADESQRRELLERSKEALGVLGTMK